MKQPVQYPPACACCRPHRGLFTRDKFGVMDRCGCPRGLALAYAEALGRKLTAKEMEAFHRLYKNLEAAPPSNRFDWGMAAAGSDL